MRNVVILTVVARDHYVPATKWPPREELQPLFILGGYDIGVCGWCRFTVAESVDLRDLRATSLLCPRCGCENRVP